jgi:Flp pilus assembly pilin Flp
VSRFADEEAGAASAEVCRRLIAIMTEAQITSGEDGFGARHGAFKVD